MKKKILAALVVGTIITVFNVVAFGVKYVEANPSRITAPDSCTSSGNSSTSSISYMSPGNATTTVTCNLQRISALAGGTDSVDSAVLAIQYHASSTALSELDWYFEYSQDGVDWYKSNNFPTLATTTLAVPQNYSWRQYSTTTVVTNGFATSSLDKKVVSVDTPTRWIRAVFTNPIGANNVGFWASFISKIEKI